MGATILEVYTSQAKDALSRYHMLHQDDKGVTPIAYAEKMREEAIQPNIIGLFLLLSENPQREIKEQDVTNIERYGYLLPVHR